MSTFNGVRFASVNARDGVNTRTKVNWAQAVKQPARKTICRSDTIIGLGQLASYQSLAGLGWGDIMTAYPRRSEDKPTRWAKVFNDYDMWEDMVEEPWKYGDTIHEWTALDEKIKASPQSGRITAFWRAREEREMDVYRADQARWRKVFKPIAAAAANKAMVRWINRDIKAFIANIKKSVTMIQALVRGYQARCKDLHQDCCMCLSHRISPLKTAVGFMCRDCGMDGPYTDQVQDDPWNWFRAESAAICA